MQKTVNFTTHKKLGDPFMQHKHEREEVTTRDIRYQKGNPDLLYRLLMDNNELHVKVKHCTCG